MILILKFASDVAKIRIALTSRQTKGFDAKKFCGALNADKDALKIQKKFRNEWK